jgi:hypothetical protein
MGLAPFQALIEAGVDMVMVGHLLLPVVDSIPSSLSPKIMTDLLRGELGFKGVVITDCLRMGALSGYGTPDEIAEMALLAGADLLLYNGKDDGWVDEWIPKAIERIERNVPQEIIDDRLERVGRLKGGGPLPVEDPLLRQKLYRAALTQIGEKKELGEEIALVQRVHDPVFARLLGKYAKIHCFSFEELDRAVKFSDLIVQIGPGDEGIEVPTGATAVFFTMPSGPVEHALVAYEDTFLAKEAAALCLFDKIPALGKLPIPLYQ